MESNVETCSPLRPLSPTLLMSSYVPPSFLVVWKALHVLVESSELLCFPYKTIAGLEGEGRDMNQARSDSKAVQAKALFILKQVFYFDPWPTTKFPAIDIAGCE